MGFSLFLIAFEVAWLRTGRDVYYRHPRGIAEAAASAKTLVFMLTGIGMLIPIIIVYNGYQYLVFKGKVSGEYGEH